MRIYLKIRPYYPFHGVGERVHRQEIISEKVLRGKAHQHRKPAERTAGHLRGDVKPAARELIAEGILLAKPTSYGLEVSLNPKKMKEINQYL